MKMTYLLMGWVLMLVTSCGPEDTIVIPVVTLTDLPTCEYTWHEDDGWAFIAWAIDIPDGAVTIALQAGYMVNEIPEPGTTINLPLAPDLQEALRLRMEAARLVREATDTLAEGDTVSVFSILAEAMDTDPSWSIPAYNYSLLLLEQDRLEEIIPLLEPWSHKYEAALVQSCIAWNNGDSEEALNQLEIALMDENPPFAVLAAAALIYTVTGYEYQASNFWLRILADPDAAPSLRLMAVQYALIQEVRASSN